MLYDALETGRSLSRFVAWNKPVQFRFGQRFFASVTFLFFSCVKPFCCAWAIYSLHWNDAYRLVLPGPAVSPKPRIF